MSKLTVLSANSNASHKQALAAYACLAQASPYFCSSPDTTISLFLRFCILLTARAQTMESENTLFHLIFTHRGATHPLALLPDTSLAYLHDRLEELTSVPPENQKLLYKGKKTVGSDATISEAGLKDGMKVQLIGPTADELGGLRATENEHQRKERILRERARKGPVKVRPPFLVFHPTISLTISEHLSRATILRPGPQDRPRSPPPTPRTPSTVSSRSRTSRTPTRRASCSRSSRTTPRSAT